MWRHFLCSLAVLLICLAGCKPRETTMSSVTASQESPAQSDGRGVMTDSVNYMHDRAVSYTLYDLSTTPPTAIGGSSVYMLATGGAQACCLNLPLAWHPGIKVRVKWTESDTKKSYPGEHVKDLEIPRYAQPANVFVVFYPGQDVEVVVSEGEPGHPAWTGRLKQTPWDYCVAKNGRKPCKAATARLFDVKGHQGFCTSTKAPDFPKENFDGDLLCASAMHECMQDYEDEDFCKGLLWGAAPK
jgi:hypothetical protein